jgi:hypothetical protein
MAGFIARIATGVTPSGTGSFTLGGSSLMDGDTPKAAVIIICDDPENPPTHGTWDANSGFSIGVTDGTTHSAMGACAESAKGTTDTASEWSETLVGLLVDENQGGQVKGTKLEISFTSFTADTITLNCSKNEESAAFPVFAFVFAGTDCAADCNIATVATSEDSSTTITHSLGSSEQLHFLTGMMGTATGEIDDFFANFGVVHWNGTTTTQRSIAGFDQDNAGSSAMSVHYRTNRCLTRIGSEEIEATSLGTNSFNVTTRGGASGAYKIAALSIDLGDTEGWVGTISGPSSAASDWAVTDIGFQSQIIGLAPMMFTGTDATTEPGSEGYGIGGVDEDGNERGFGWNGNDGAGTSGTDSNATASFAYVAEGHLTRYTVASNPTIDASGFDVANADIAFATASQNILAWAVKTEAAPPAGPPAGSLMMMGVGV